MSKLGILAATAAALLAVFAWDANAGRGGAARSGVRGAVVGGAIGGESGAATGAKVGVVTNATRNLMNTENTTRAQYQSTPAYQTVPHANFNEAAPDVMATTTTAKAVKPSGESVIKKNGKPLVGVTFPEDWNEKVGDNYISAVSKDGQCNAMFAVLDGVADSKAAVAKVKKGLENYLQDMKFDEPETKGDATAFTGTGKAKKAGVDVTFAAGVFEAAKGQFVGAAFVADSKTDEYYTATVKGICETIRRADDFNAKK